MREKNTNLTNGHELNLCVPCVNPCKLCGKIDTDYTNFHRLKPCVFTLKSRDFFAFGLNLICPYLPYMVQKTPAI